MFKISPILSTAENIQTRINEVELIILPTIRHDAEIAKENVSEILQFKGKFDALCDQIDSLEAMVNRVKSDLVKIQKQVEIADEELDIPEKKLDIFLKSINIFAKPRDPSETNYNENGIYQAPEIFKSDEFFERKIDGN